MPRARPGTYWKACANCGTRYEKSEADPDNVCNDCTAAWSRAETAHWLSVGLCLDCGKEDDRHPNGYCDRPRHELRDYERRSLSA